MRIEESATRKQARIDSSQDVVVGVNKYRLESEQPMEVLQIDNSAVRAKQVTRLQELKANRDEAAAQDVLARLEASARLDRSTSHGDDPDNLVALSVEAAQKHCTLGEISLALEKAWGRHVPSSAVVQGAYSSSYSTGTGGSSDDEYDATLERVNNFEKTNGRRPRILVAKLGLDGHDRAQKVIASGFSDLGFDVDIGPLFQTPEEVAVQALDSDVHVIGISSQAAGHRTLMPALKKELEAKGLGHVVVVAGGVIPPQDYDFLIKESKSCSAVFGPGTRVLDAANQVLNLISEKST